MCACVFTSWVAFVLTGKRDSRLFLFKHLTLQGKSLLPPGILVFPPAREKIQESVI